MQVQFALNSVSGVDLMCQQATRLSHSSVLSDLHSTLCDAEVSTAEGDTCVQLEVMCSVVVQHQQFVRFAVACVVCCQSVFTAH